MAERLCCSQRACGLVGIVGSFSSSLWACGHCCGRTLDELVGLSVYRARLLGYYMCGGTHFTPFFLGKIEFFKNKKMAVSSRAVDCWTDVTRFSSVTQFWHVGTRLVRWFEN